MDELILTAIALKTLLRFTYQGLERRCEPHVFGVCNGRKQLLCWQLSGSSHRDALPEWRRFDLGDIKDLERLESESFPGKRPVPHPYSLGWDQIISVVD